MPAYRFSKAFSVRRDTKVFLNLQGGLTRGRVPDPERHKERAEKLKNVVSRQKKALQRKDRKIEELAARLEYLERERQREGNLKAELKDQRLETFVLKNELHAMKELVERARDVPSAAGVLGEPEVGTLPDFIIIGAQKCGTTALYVLLTNHPSVKPAGVRELHFFDLPERFAKGPEWYRRCFPTPQWKNGRRSITGEKTPYYLFHPHVPERMAEVVPRVRLMVLLRNPVDRAYSQYHHEMSMMQSRERGKPGTFEEAIEQKNSSYLPRGIYVDQLQRWFEYFSKDQMLILKSEDFFEQTAESLRLVHDYLELPHHELESSNRERTDRYPPMNPDTRRRLEAYFEPHNQRLYEFLGVDFGW